MAASRSDVLARLTDSQRALFWTKVDRCGDADCWPWQGSVHPNGYGTWTVALGRQRTTSVRPHRVAWHLDRGAIPDGLTIDHLCRNKVCCNPNHLEPVTQAVNNERQIRVKRDSRKATIRERTTRSGVTFAVLYRTLDGRQSSRSFRTRIEAERFVELVREVGASRAEALVPDLRVRER